MAINRPRSSPRPSFNLGHCGGNLGRRRRRQRGWSKAETARAALQAGIGHVVSRHPRMLLGGNSTNPGDAAKETNHRSPRPRSTARAMAGLLARGSTTDADLPGCPVITSGVVLPLTVAGAATASAFRPAPCSLLIPEGNHQGLRIALPGRRQPRRRTAGIPPRLRCPPPRSADPGDHSRRRRQPRHRRRRRRPARRLQPRPRPPLHRRRRGNRRLEFRRRPGDAAAPFHELLDAAHGRCDCPPALADSTVCAP